MGRPLSAHQKSLVETLLPKIGLGEGPIDLRALFSNARSFALEIGFGGGEHLAAQARSHPDTGFIGCEPFVNGVAKLLAQIDAEHLANVRVHMGDAREVLSRLPDASLSAVYALFPDPWPKARHHKRRFVQRHTLAELARVMRQGGELRLATDHAEYAAWALSLLMHDSRFRWTAQRAADWRARPSDWPATRYELKALKDGRGCNYLSFVRA